MEGGDWDTCACTGSMLWLDVFVAPSKGRYEPMTVSSLLQRSFAALVTGLKGSLLLRRGLIVDAAADILAAGGAWQCECSRL